MRRLSLAVVVILAAAAWPRAAQAFPQWQFSTDATRCDQCHFAPAGTGLINNFGRDFVGEDGSTFGGNGAFLHGLVTPPSWLSLGADVRGALASRDTDDINGTNTAVFPMQADAEVRASYSLVSFYGVLGYRGQVRSDNSVVPTQNYQPITDSRLISREHYLMVRASALGGYLRAGRFFAPFGLRLAEHIVYVRRDLGFGTMEESYNLSGGYVAERWEAHVTAFAPDYIRHMGSREGGLTAYYERRFADIAAAAPQLRVAVGPGMTRTIVGGVGKVWLAPARTMLLGEADFVRRDISNVSSASYQFVGLLGASVMPTKGIMATVLGERDQVDLAVSGAAYDAVSLLVNFFPYAHFDVQAMGRLDIPSGGQLSKLFFLQIHYFL
jgi:hypothetical protein